MNKSKNNNRFKSYRKTKKNNKNYYGGESPPKSKISNGSEERVGVFDVIQEKTTDLASDAGKYIYDKGLLLLGAEPIKKSNQLSQIDNGINKLASNATNLVSKSTENVIEGVNSVLGSDMVKNKLNVLATNTKEITENLMNSFNEPFDNPNYKKKLTTTLKNAADIAEISLKALDKPIDTALEKINESATKATAGIASGAVKVGTDLMAAVPGFGAVIELGKVINDASKATASVAEAASETTEAVSDLIGKTSLNFSHELKKFKESKNIGKKIAERTEKSISDFKNSNPINSVVPSGGNRTRKYRNKSCKRLN